MLNRNRACITRIKNDGESDNFVLQSRYDFFLNKYKEEEKRAIDKADRAVMNAQMLIGDVVDNPIKKKFLQAFVDYHKYNCINRLINYSKYEEYDMYDVLDPFFFKAAEKIVQAQELEPAWSYDLLGSEYDFDREQRIEEQLYDNGILDKTYDGYNVTICVQTLYQLHEISKFMKGKSLLTKSDKERLNSYFEQRRMELVGNHKLHEVFLTDIPNSHKELVNVYKDLCKSKFLWELAPSAIDAYSCTKTVRKRTYFPIGNFNYLVLPNNMECIGFKFNNEGICFYIYPKFVIVARSFVDFESSLNFEIYDIKQFSITFKKQNYIEERWRQPKDAHVTRYTEDTKCPICEYGCITFLSHQLTMVFSNSVITESFYHKYIAFKNDGEEFEEDIFGTTKEYFDKANSVAKSLCDFYDKLLCNIIVCMEVNKIVTDEIGNAQEKIRSLFLADLITCFEQLGHSATELYCREGLPLVLVEAHTVSSVKITYETVQLNEIRNVVDSVARFNKVSKSIFKNKAKNELYLNDIFVSCGKEDLKTQYFTLLYRLFTIITKADGKVSVDEERCLENLILYSKTAIEQKTEVVEIVPVGGVNSIHKETESSTKNNEVDPLKELFELIGLSEVKGEVESLANFVKIQQEREKKGLKPVALSYHCVFTGNPGTGKTTVARILANIYRSLGILKKGHLVETDRSGLVAEYVGQTAAKTNKIIDSALDGVLFIDEAYSLVQGGGNDYGHEAISTLLKRMEDDRERLVVVLAGYSEDMKEFIDSNPGLQSRFNRYIHFSDYTEEELKQIFLLNVKKNQYVLDDKGLLRLAGILKTAIEHKNKNFGNGRYVRNLFEKTIQNQAMRLASRPKVSVDDLTLLIEDDLPKNEVYNDNSIF